MTGHRIAVSGHRALNEQTTRLVDDAIRAHLSTVNEHLVGLSCLADGADQLFARAVLDAGGQLTVIVPAAEYREGLPASAHVEYDTLIARATQIHELDYIESTSDSHMAASQRMLDDADELVAVWDGQPARGYGGTADVVAAARKRDLTVTVVWPDGATR